MAPCANSAPGCRAPSSLSESVPYMMQPRARIADRKYLLVRMQKTLDDAAALPYIRYTD